MKRTLTRYSRVFAALALLWAASPTYAAQEIVYSFDTEDTALKWSHYWGGPDTYISFDPNMDAADDLANSGAIRFEVNFDVVTWTNNNQFCFRFELPASVAGTNFEKVAMDVFVDPTSPPRPPTEPYWDFGGLSFGSWYSDWSQNFVTNVGLSLVPGWQHLEAFLPNQFDDPKTTNISGVVLTMWSGDPVWGQSGLYTFWVDNVKFIPPPPPPVGTNIVMAFDDQSEVLQWQYWWGNPITLEFDPAMDAQTNANSGSMKLTLNFDTSRGGDNQFCVNTKQWGWDNVLSCPSFVDGLLYTNIELDVFVDPASALKSDGTFGNFGYGVWFTNWNNNNFCNATLSPSAEPGWVHMSANMPETDPRINGVTGLVLYMWSGGTENGNQNGPFTLWVDNIKMVAKGSNAPVVLQPNLYLSPVGRPGMHVAATTGYQWQREGIRTFTQNNSWANKTMEFSMTVADFPDTNHLGFVAQMFLVPTSITASESAPDWSQPHCAIFTVGRNADGSGWGAFMFKTNQPSGNSMYWNTDPANPNVGVGSLGGVWGAKPEGTWTLRMDQSTLNLISADATNTIPMPIELVDLFGDPVYAYFGIQPNGTNNLGQSAVITRIQISSPDAPEFVPVDDSFLSGTLDPAVWENAAEDRNAVVLVSDTDAFWLHWTLPDSGFKLYSSPTMARGSWVIPDPPLPAPVVKNGGRWILVPKAALTTTPNCFFVLKK